ncbi:NUDIX hydrolase [Bifidobacterium sp.]|uniref:NUDIX hydrolase n=1 Tax=Bifidobacterium sp. TaxID=41200 RepID=UPI0025C26692|nr:NUDIX hydrolase [Bifidobacterium sp.]MCH4209187.1 NUDIX hydrolase [Bifidobacterium sp.]MCI1224633.1 NUDIX hydrolase [Bifidobacterium sp.]
MQGTRIDMGRPARITRSDTVYQGAIFSVEDRTVSVSSRGGERLDIRRQVVLHAPSVVMLVHDLQRDLYLAEREYRAGSNIFAYGIPAGLMNEDEDPERAALRELREETGVEADAADLQIDRVGDFYSSEGMTDELVHVMVLHLKAWRATSRHFDEDEYVESAWVSWSELTILPIASSNSVIAIQHETLRRVRARTC